MSRTILPILPPQLDRDFAVIPAEDRPRQPNIPSSVYLETFGCQMNEYDSELIRSVLKSHGFVFTEALGEADVVLLNTCAIRENAHNRVYGHLANLKALKRQRHLVVGVLGCMAQNLKGALAEAEPLIDLLIGPDGYRRLPTLLAKALEPKEGSKKSVDMALELSEYETYHDILPERIAGVNAWIAIMRGCDNFCSFCVVPYTRGRERSRAPEHILQEAEQLLGQGFKQITLLGQNVNSYQYGGCDFAQLLTSVADLHGVERVRFTSPHPKAFPQSLLDAVADHPRLCKHIHLPLQAGNDRILNLMNRTYSRDEYHALVGKIRQRIPGIVLTTDIICGFCTETEEEFQDTLRMVEQVEFHGAFIFKYSKRTHTIAERKFQDNISEQEKARRVNRLVERQRAITLKKNRALIGDTLSVLVEGHAKKSASQWMGKTDTNLTVVWETPRSHNTSPSPGALIPITIHDASAATLFGQPSRPA